MKVGDDRIVQCIRANGLKVLDLVIDNNYEIKVWEIEDEYVMSWVGDSTEWSAWLDEHKIKREIKEWLSRYVLQAGRSVDIHAEIYRFPLVWVEQAQPIDIEVKSTKDTVAHLI